MKIDRLVEKIEIKLCWNCCKLKPAEVAKGERKRAGGRLIMNGCEINRRMHSACYRSAKDRAQVWPVQVNEKLLSCKAYRGKQ